MRRVIVSLLLGAVLLGILSWQSRPAAAGSGKCKVKADGGYVVTYGYDFDSERYVLGDVVEEADEDVLFCWELPKDKRITGIHGTKTLWDGSTESAEDITWLSNLCCYGTTGDGKVIWGYEVYPSQLKGFKELLISPQIEDVDREPIVFDLRNGVAYYGDESSTRPGDFGDIKPLFRACGDWCNTKESVLEWYSVGPLYVDIDKDGSWDVEVTSEARFTEAYDGSWWDDHTGVILSLPTRNVSEDYSVTLELDPEKTDINHIGDGWDRLFDQYGLQIPVIFRFGEEPTKEKHSVSVDGGYAEKYNPSTGSWEKVTSAAPGDELRISRSSFEGKYVSAWKSNYWSYDSINAVEQKAQSCKWVYMPGADVSFTAVKSPQTPYYLDLSQGFFRIGYFDDAVSDIRNMISAGYNRYETNTFDLDGDGTFDISIYEWGDDPVDDTPDQVVLVPLPTALIKGNYTLSGLNDGPNWPLVIKFPEQVYGRYAVTVKGGRAIDKDGNVVTHAAPGTRLFIETDFGGEDGWIQYKSDLKEYWDENTSVYFEGRGYFFMPAHDIVITPYQKDGDVIITPTPDPDEITPTPGPDEVTPTPDEITPIPSVTPDGKDPAENLTPVPTVSEADGKEEAADASKKDKDKQEDDGFNLLYILIPVCAVLIAVAAAAFWMLKKKPSKTADKKVTEEVPAEASKEASKAESDGKEDDYL